MAKTKKPKWFQPHHEQIEKPNPKSLGEIKLLLAEGKISGFEAMKLIRDLNEQEEKLVEETVKKTSKTATVEKINEMIESLKTEIEEIESEEETKSEILDKILSFMAHSEQKSTVFILTKTDEGIVMNISNQWLPLIEEATHCLSENIISHIVFSKMKDGKINATLVIKNAVD